MSAEMLRRAAALMRVDFEVEDVDDIAVAELHLAVADLLDYHADTADMNGRNWPLSDSHQWIPTQAIDVASAYLRESA